MSSPMLGAGVYARLGLKVIPLHSARGGVCSCAKGSACPSAGKHPRFREWQNEASSEAAVIADWKQRFPEANVGVATGEASGFFVLDVDPDGDGPATLARLIEEHGELPHTPQALTGSGGSHFLFALPDFEITNSAGKLGPGLDTRGNGGQIVVAPSVSAKGAYRWIVEPWNTPLAPAPDWLLELLRRKPERAAAPNKPTLDVGEFPPASPEVLAAAREALEVHGPAVEGQGGDQHTFVAACLLVHDFALTEEEAWPLFLEWNESCQPQWSESDLNAKLRGGNKYASRPFGCRRSLDAVAGARALIAKWQDGARTEELMWSMIEKVRGFAALCDDKAKHAVIARDLKVATGLPIQKLGLPPAGAARLEEERERRRSEFAAGSPQVIDTEDPYATAKRLLVTTRDGDGFPALVRHQEGWWRAALSKYESESDEAIRRQLYRFVDGKQDLKSGAAIKPDRGIVETLQHALVAAAAPDGLAGKSPPAWIGDDVFPAHELIACSNGLLHTSSRTFLAPTRRFFNTNAIEFAYDEDAERPAEWEAFLHQVCGGDVETVETLQEFAGLWLTSDTSFQKGLVIIGPPRSGKGTFSRVIDRLIGRENITAPTLGGLGQQFGLQPLIGKLLATVSDARLGGRADQGAVVENLLRTTGEDTLSIPRKHRDDWVGKLPTRFLFLSNELPAFLDASGALPSRFILTRFTRSFLGTEDRALESRLVTELPGILLWALDGLDRLRKRGHFRQPSAALDLVRQLADLASPIKAFTNDCCELAAGATVECSALFAAWQIWASEQGRKDAGTAPMFGRNLTSAHTHIRTVQQRINGSRVRLYEGITLVSRDGTRAEPLRSLSKDKENKEQDAA